MIDPKTDQMSMKRTARDGGRSAARWSDLPDDLLGAVRSRILFLRDRVRFAAVCRPWRAAASLQPAAAVAPMLLLSLYGRNKTYHLCGPDDSWVFRAPTPRKEANVRFVGSHDGGWIALLDEDKYTLAIMNLFSGAEVALSEKQRRMTSICSFGAPYPYNIKIIFSGDPTSSNGCILAAIIDGCLHVTLCRVGCHDGRWTTCRYGRGLIDIAFCNGELYGLTSYCGTLIKYEIGMEGDCMLAVTDIQRLAIQRPTWYNDNYISHIFELHGKPSMALRTRWLPNLDPFFKIFILTDPDAYGVYKYKWVEVTSFGDYAIFLGPTGSKAVHVPVSAEHGNLRRNHMYYTKYTHSFISKLPDDAVYSVTSIDGDKIKMYSKNDQGFEHGMERTGYYVTGSNFAMWVHPPDV